MPVSWLVLCIGPGFKHQRLTPKTHSKDSQQRLTPKTHKKTLTPNTDTKHGHQRLTLFIRSVPTPTIMILPSNIVSSRGRSWSHPIWTDGRVQKQKVNFCVKLFGKNFARINFVLHSYSVAVILCGGNIDSNMFGRCIERGLIAVGRLLRWFHKR